jgi:hypothetical protein
MDPDTQIGDLDGSVVYERHHALNWLTCSGADNALELPPPDWDSVDTNTV